MNNMYYSLATCFRYAPRAAGLYLALNVADGLIAPLLVWPVAAFLTKAAAVAAGSAPVAQIAVAVAALLGLYAWLQCSGAVAGYLAKDMENSLRVQFRPQLVAKQAGLKLSLIEDNGIQDLLQAAVEKAETRLAEIFTSLCALLRNAVQVTGVLCIAARYEWWVLAGFAALLVPLAVMSCHGGRKIYRVEKDVTHLTRYMNYLSEILLGHEAAAERALFQSAGEINRRFAETHLKRSNLNTRVIALWNIRVKLFSIALNVFVCLTLFLLIRRVADGTMATGLYIALAGTLFSVAATVSGTPDLLFDFSANREYLRELARFLALPDDDGARELVVQPQKFESLEIRDLRFRYDGCGDYVLKGVNLSISAGQCCALAGLNGAGKTTLIKLLTGLYREYEGDIFLNGRELRSMSLMNCATCSE